MVASTAGGSCCNPAAAEELTAAPLTFPSLTHRLSLSSPEAQQPDSTSKTHCCFTRPAPTLINLTSVRLPKMSSCRRTAGRVSSVRPQEVRFTCVWPRAAAPRLRSQLPSTSHTRTLGPGQQLFFTRAAVGAESIIIEERIAVVKISLRCRRL